MNKCLKDYHWLSVSADSEPISSGLVGHSIGINMYYKNLQQQNRRDKLEQNGLVSFLKSNLFTRVGTVCYDPHGKFEDEVTL